MSTEDPIRALLREAYHLNPTRLARLRPDAAAVEQARADGAYRAYLRCLALILGTHRLSGHETPEHDTTAWPAAFVAILGQAAARDELDLDAIERAVRTVVGAQPLPAPRRPRSMQERILGALTDLAQRAGWQVSIQPQYANTGHVYVTAVNAFAVGVEASYHFDADSCGLHFHGPAIEALGLQDSPPEYRYEPGGRLSYHALRYADGARITAMLDLLARALESGTS